MAISRMMRVSVIGHAAVLDQTVRRLQRAGVIEIDVSEIPFDEIDALEPDQDRLNVLEERIGRALFVRDFLNRFHTSDAPFSSLISEKVHLSVSEFERLAEEDALGELCVDCDVMAERLGVIEREHTHLKELVHDLAPWEGLHLQISQWKGTEHVVLFTGTVPVTASDEIRQTLRESVTDVSVAEVGATAQLEAWVVMAHRDSLEEVRAILALTEFVEVSFPGLEDYPAEERSRAAAAMVALEEEKAEIEASSRVLAAEYHARAVGLVQSLLTLKDAEEARSCVCASERAFVVTGWAPERRREDLVAALEPIDPDIDLTFDDPGPEDVVPVELSNPNFLKPFEVLTDLYGRPRYGDIDPTPLLAGFFFLFFGITIGDVGYGAMLLTGAWLVKNKLDVAAGVRKFMDLVMLGGVASMLVGVATRGYFALPEQSLPAFLQYQPLIDPLGQLELFLILAVLLGVVQVSFGVIVSAYARWKAGDVAGALFEELSTIALFIAVGAALALPDAAGAILTWAFALAVVLKGRIVEEIFVRRSAKGAITGFGKGLLGLYGLVGYTSDFLSYTRLAALGLASLLVGDVMNRLAGLVSGVPYGIGLLAAALIIIVGHTFNVLINLLGGFIHSMRLQFVEFFGKFYEGAGRSFAPFSPRTKSVVLHPDPGAPEGGA